jgi:hypothetical protein
MLDRVAAFISAAFVWPADRLIHEGGRIDQAAMAVTDSADIKKARILN